MFAFGAPSAPVANWGVLGFPEALTIYNFIYSRFPSAAGSGPSSQSRARLVEFHRQEPGTQTSFRSGRVSRPFMNDELEGGVSLAIGILQWGSELPLAYSQGGSRAGAFWGRER